MICSLLENLPDGDDVVVVTVLHTEGHTYKKAGEKAVFVAGDPVPRWGNLGSLCVDQELARDAVAVCDDGRPKRTVIDMTDETDAQLGYGTYCGGKMELLLEPILASHRAVYAELLSSLRAGKEAFVTHDLEGGELRLSASAPETNDGIFVEAFKPPHELAIFGATPLAREIVVRSRDMDIDVHVIDWRQAYLDALSALVGVALHLDDYPLTERSFVLVVSHSFERDLQVVERALSAQCGYIGLLSSRKRRDKMFETLSESGVAASELARISSPVGINIGAQTDAEIAVSILAEIVKQVRT